MRPDERIALVLFVAVVAGVFVVEAATLARGIAARLRGMPEPPRSYARRAVHALAVAGIACILWGAAVEPYRLAVTRLEISTAKLDRRVRIVHLSDTHCDPIERLEPHVVAAANALHPDLVLFTGDTINDPAGLDRFKAMIAALEAPAGKFACLGNYDVNYWRDLDLFGGTGMTPLSGTVAVAVGSAEILLAGFPIDRFRAAGEAARALPAATLSVFLFHTPDIALLLDGDARPDLVLAGHTHGGQIALPLLGPVITFTRVGRSLAAGRFPLPGGGTLYVSRGIGMEGGRAPRVRFLAPPELVVIDLVPDRQDMSGGRR